MVWTFSKDEGVQHFLIGTMHVGCQAAYTFAATAKQAILSSDVYLGESNLDELEALKVSEVYHLPSDQSWQDLMSPRHYQRLCKILKKSFNIEPTVYASMRPLVVLNLLASQILQEGQLLPLDHYLWQYAATNDKIRDGVETATEQQEILLSIDVEEQARQLIKAMRNVSSFRKITRHTAKLYASGRYQQLYKTSAKSLGRLRKALVYQRNALMAERLLARLLVHPAQRITVAVGAGHIGGNTGLRAALLRAGYTVKAIA